MTGHLAEAVTSKAAPDKIQYWYYADATTAE